MRAFNPALIPIVKTLLTRFGQFDFAQCSTTALARWTVAILLLLPLFGVFDVIADTGASVYDYLTGLLAKGNNPLPTLLNPAQLPMLAYGVIGALMIYISAFAFISFRVSLRQHGRDAFMPVFLAHFLSNLVAMAASFLLFAVLGLIAYLLGFHYRDGAALLDHGYQTALDFLSAHIPTITVLPYPLALVAAAILGGLPGYFSHWLAHHSRFVWYAAHRCHHSAEIMHPVGVGPFMFLPEVFGNLPAIVLTAASTKLFSHEPLLFDVVVLGSIGVLQEKFNHSTAFYDFAFRNPVVRTVSAYFGGGVYHYMHHTATPGDEIVNLGGGPFLFWDRVFGTYRTPPAIKPRVGLTRNPKIRLNPFAIVFSGWQQIAYELRANRDWTTRFWIVFGTVYFAPPISKDYLIEGYPDDAPSDAIEPGSAATAASLAP
ncbi:MAG: sterol desaturase family protein [Burkholderiales bacterium]|nr:sterol desaturase family protein [Burkholderiales bacterium]